MRPGTVVADTSVLVETVLLERIFALHPVLTPHDAAYVALAEVLEAPLTTFDATLARAPGIAGEDRGARAARVGRRQPSRRG